MCVFIPHFVGVYGYAGTINRPLRLLTVCQNAANNLSITQHSPTKHVANIPSGVGTDSSRPYPDITKYTYPFQQIRIFALSNMRFRSPFCGCLRICKHQKIVHQRKLATCYNTTTYTKCLLLHCKNHTFAM